MISSSTDMELDVVSIGQEAHAPRAHANGSVMLYSPGKTQTYGASINGSATTSGSRTPLGDDWELDCEICSRRGVNVVSIILLFRSGRYAYF
jgi:hypothetical protein